MMKAADTRASIATADWTPLTVVSRSSTTAEIETFMNDVSMTKTNIAIARRMPRRGVPVCSEDIPSQYSSRRERIHHPVGVNRHDAGVTRLRQFATRIGEF